MRQEPSPSSDSGITSLDQLTVPTGSHLAVARALEEGFGVPPLLLYDTVRCEFLTAVGTHPGHEVLSRVRERPALAGELIARAQRALEDASAAESALRTSTVDDELPFIHDLKAFGEIVRALYRGALDEIVPADTIRRHVAAAADVSAGSELVWAAMEPADGRDTVWYRRHGILLYLASALAPAFVRIQCGTYEQFDAAWLNRNFTPLSRDEAYDVSGRSVGAAVSGELRKLGLLRAESTPELPILRDEDDFQVVREALRDLQLERKGRVTKGARARSELVLRAAPADRAWVRGYLDLMAESLRINETIHQRICVAANLLRIKAGRIGLPVIPLELAF